VKKPLSKPFFSIVIPTYNRARDLKRTITAILQQNFHDFEVIVSDNNSKDETKRVMSEFTDLRIRYFRNKRNLGWIPNLQRAINHSIGTYVLLHGDDDFMLNSDFLKRLHKKLQLEPAGFVRVNYLSYSDDQNILFDFHNRLFVTKIISKILTADQIFEIVDAVDPFFITGIVIRGDILRSIPLMQSEYAPWLPSLYQAIKNANGFVWSDYEFVATWSKNYEYPRYYLANGKYQFEQYFEEIKKHVSETYYRGFLDKRLRILIREFPAAKYFTSNSNFYHYAIHLLDLDPAFRYSFVYWFWFIFSILTPRRILHILREKMVEVRKDDTIPNLSKIYRRIDLLNTLVHDTS